LATAHLRCRGIPVTPHEAVPALFRTGVLWLPLLPPPRPVKSPRQTLSERPVSSLVQRIFHWRVHLSHDQAIMGHNKFVLKWPDHVPSRVRAKVWWHLLYILAE